MAGQKKHSGSKKSYCFGNEGRKFHKSSWRPSPRRRPCSRSRDRGSGEGRKVSRSPGRRSECPAFSTCDEPKQQPAKLISVPATEKGSFFVNGDTDSTRSRSPANNNCMSNESTRSQILSRCSSLKADKSPFWRNPMAEMDENSLGNQNGGDIQSREVDNMAIQSLIIDMSNADIVEEDVDAELNGGVESLNPSILTRTRSSRKTSCDLDSNPILKSASKASFMLEDIHNHQQNTAFSFPTCAYKASSCSEQRSHETDQSNNNYLQQSGLARKREEHQCYTETLTESELEVKNDLKKPSIHKYVSAREEMPLSTDHCCTSLPCNGIEGFVWQATFSAA